MYFQFCILSAIKKAIWSSLDICFVTNHLNLPFHDSYILNFNNLTSLSDTVSNTVGDFWSMVWLTSPWFKKLCSYLISDVPNDYFWIFISHEYFLTNSRYFLFVSMNTVHSWNVGLGLSLSSLIGFILRNSVVFFVQQQRKHIKKHVSSYILIIF